jgi:hypothetical protein
VTTDIDLVFTYVDGADPAHRAKRAQFSKTAGPELSSWFVGVGEITYAVRSALRFAPWLRTIFIVSDSQYPPIDAELLANGRVRLVDHAAIIPEAYRPAFDSTVIESFLHHIPGLSSIFLYNNDDFLFGAPVKPEDFMQPSEGATPRLLLRTIPALLRDAIRTASDHVPAVPRANIYTCGISNAARLLRQAGYPWRDIVVPRHVTQVYRLATAHDVERQFAADLHAARSLHVKSRQQLSWSTLAYSLEARLHKATVSSVTDVMTRHRQELFLDLARDFPWGTKNRSWRKLEGSTAPFICVNNVQPADKRRFSRIMVQRGLGPDMAEDGI